MDQVLLTNPNFGSAEVESSIVMLSLPVIGVQNPELDKPIHSESSNINTKEILQVRECGDAKQPINQPVMDTPLPIPSSSTSTFVLSDGFKNGQNSEMCNDVFSIARSNPITIQDLLLKPPSSNDTKLPLVQGMTDTSLPTASPHAGNEMAINFIKLPTVTIKDNATVHQVPQFVINQPILIGSPANSLCLPMQPAGIFQQYINTSFSSSSMVCPGFVPQIQQQAYINLSSAAPIVVAPKEPPPQYPKVHEINFGVHNVTSATSSAVGMHVLPPPPAYPNNSLSNCGIYVISNLANNSSTSTASAIAKSTVPSRHPPNASSYPNNSLSNCFVSVTSNLANNSSTSTAPVIAKSGVPSRHPPNAETSAKSYRRTYPNNSLSNRGISVKSILANNSSTSTAPVIATSTVPLLHPPNALSSSYGTTSTASLSNNNLNIRVAGDIPTSTVSSALRNTRDININLQRATPPSAAPYIITCLAPPPPYRQASLNNCGIIVKVAKDPPTSTTSPSVCGTDVKVARVSSTSLSNCNISTSVTGNTPTSFSSRGNCDLYVATARTAPSSTTPVMGMHYALPPSYQNISLNSKGTQVSMPNNTLPSKSPSMSISPGPIPSCPTAPLYTRDIKIEPLDETQTSEAAKRCKILDMFELSKPIKDKMDDFPAEELTVEVDPSNYLDSSDIDFPEKLFPDEICEQDFTAYQPTSMTDQHLVEKVVHEASNSHFSPHLLKAASSSEVVICPEDTFEPLNDQFQPHKNPQQIANVAKPFTNSEGYKAPKATQYKMRYLPRKKGLDRTFFPYKIKTANLPSSPHTISSDIESQANNMQDQLTKSPEMMSGIAEPLFCKVIMPFTNYTENDSPRIDQNEYRCIAPKVYSEHFDSPNQTKTANLPSVPHTISDVKSQANSVLDQLTKNPEMMPGTDKPLVANVAKPFVPIASKPFTNFTDNSSETAQNKYWHCFSYQINGANLASLQAIPNQKSEANDVPNELTSSLRAISGIAKPLDNSCNNVLKALVANPQRKIVSKQASSQVLHERANSSLKISSVGLSESKLAINPRQVKPLHNTNVFEKICNSDNEGSADSYLFTEQRQEPAGVTETSQVPSAPERPLVSIIPDAKMNSSCVKSHEQSNSQNRSTAVRGIEKPTQNLATVILPFPPSGIQHPHLSQYLKTVTPISSMNSSGVKSAEQFNHQTCINSGVEIVIGSSVKISCSKEAVVKPWEIPKFYDEEHCYSIRCRPLPKGDKISDKCVTKLPELLKKSVAMSANKFPEMSQRSCRVLLKRLNAAHFEGLTVNLRKVTEQDLFSPVRQSSTRIKKECTLRNDWRRSSRLEERKFHLTNNLRQSSTLKQECNLKNNWRQSSRLKEKTLHAMENSRKTSKSPRIKEEVSPRATLKKPTVKDAATSPCPSPFCDHESLALDANPDIVEQVKRQLKIKLEALENFSHSRK